MKANVIAIAVCCLAAVNLSAQSADEKTLTAFSKSYEYEYAKNYTKAYDILKEAYYEKSYDLNFRMGWLSYTIGDQKNAVMYYKKAIELSPKSVEARMGLVYPLSVMQNWDEVAKVYQEVLKIDPNHSVANYRLGLIAYNKKDYTKALEYCNKVKELYPFDYDTNLLIGKTYISLGKITEAKLSLQTALRYDPTSSEAKTLLSKI